MIIYHSLPFYGFEEKGYVVLAMCICQKEKAIYTQDALRSKTWWNFSLPASKHFFKAVSVVWESSIVLYITHKAMHTYSLSITVCNSHQSVHKCCFGYGISSVAMTSQSCHSILQGFFKKVIGETTDCYKVFTLKPGK